MKRTTICCLALLSAAACGRADDGDQMPPPAAAMAAATDVMTLAQRLEQIDRDLGAVLDRGIDDESRALLYRVEAVTDRLLESEPDVAWLAAGYDVEARLRQAQALADRVVAEMRRDVNRELLLQDVAALRFSIRDLRTQMAEPGGGEAPPPLDSLLAGVQDPLRSRATGEGTAGEGTSSGAGQPSQPGLLGTPVD